MSFRVSTRRLCFYALLLASGLATAQGSFETPVLNVPTTKVIVVPLTIHRGLAFVAVDLGDKPASLYVNTGGGHALTLTRRGLTGRVFQKLEPAGHYQDAFGRIFHAQRFAVSTMVMGGLVLHDLVGSELISGPPHSDGYLGLLALRSYGLVFDYPGREMRLYPPENAGAMRQECPQSLGTLSSDDEGLKSILQTEQGSFSIVWDTGASASIMRPSALPTSARRSGLPWQTPQWQAPHATIGGADAGPITFQLLEFLQPPVDGVLGYDFFKSRVVCFDVQKSWVGIGSNDLRKQ